MGLIIVLHNMYSKPLDRLLNNEAVACKEVTYSQVLVDMY